MLLWVVLGLVAVAGVLVLALDRIARQRNRLAHRASHARVADALAEGTAAYVQLLMRHALAGGASALAHGGDLAAAPLPGFLLQPAADLEAALAKKDAGDWLAHWFGPGARFPIDQMLANHPGATVEVAFEVEARDLHRGRFQDPLEKIVDWGLVVRARYRGVERTSRATYGIKVVHPFPPLVSKFTLFAGKVPNPSRELNVFQNRDDGTNSADRFQAPFVLQNTALGDFTDRQFMATNLPNLARDQNPWQLQDLLRQAIDQRGWVYLGSPPGTSEAVRLNLTAGPSLYDATGAPVPDEPGEFFHVYDALGGSQPAFFYLPEGYVPEPFQHPLVAPDGASSQPFINFLFWGFHADGVDSLERAGLGPTLGTDRSSILHLFGQDDDPSRTRVFGPVEHAYIRLAYLAVDRLPGADDDEATQRATAASLGLGPEVVQRREVAEPIFAHVPDAGTWSAELGREAGGQPLQVLEPIPNTTSGLDAPENRNFGLDTDGDGRKDVFLDPAHPTVPLDAAVYNYATLFPDGFGAIGDEAGTGYARYMSRVEVRPMTQFVDYMVYSGVMPPERHPAFPGWTAGDLDAHWSAEDVALPWGDPLHQALGSPPAFQGGLADFLESGELEDVMRARATVVVPDQAAFFRRYRPGPSALVPGDPSPVLVLDDVVLVQQGPLTLEGLRFLGAGAIVVGSGDVTLDGFLPVQYSMPTVVALDGDLVLRGVGTQVGFFAAPRGQLVNGDGTPKSLRGSLAVGRLRSEALETGGELRWEASGDPTRVLGQGRPSYADYYRTALSSAPSSWSPAQ